MGADGVEVAQQGDLPGGVGGIKILKDLLDHKFGSADEQRVTSDLPLPPPKGEKNDHPLHPRLRQAQDRLISGCQLKAMGKKDFGAWVKVLRVKG